MNSTVKIKIDGVPSDYASLPLGRQMEFHEVIKAFKETAKTGHVNQKRKKASHAFHEFLRLHGAKQYYANYHDSDLCRDDVYRIWYKP
jgi:hypothetical protein